MRHASWNILILRRILSAAPECCTLILFNWKRDSFLNEPHRRDCDNSSFMWASSVCHRLLVLQHCGCSPCVLLRHLYPLTVKDASVWNTLPPPWEEEQRFAACQSSPVSEAGSWPVHLSHTPIMTTFISFFSLSSLCVKDWNSWSADREQSVSPHATSQTFFCFSSVKPVSWGASVHVLTQTEEVSSFFSFLNSFPSGYNI